MALGVDQPERGKKLFVGPRFRRIRQQLGLSQTQIAEGLGISPSYINLIERNQRPVTAQILLRLAETYDLDLRDLATADEDRFFAELNEIFSDPLFRQIDLPKQELRDLAELCPGVTHALQSLQGVRHAGAEFGEVAQFLLRQVDLPEQGIGEDLVQFGEEAVLVGGGEVAQIEVIGLRQPQQDLRRHRALVALDQVDIARRNAEALGDLGLRQPQLLADPPEPRTDKQFLSRITGHGSLSNPNL